MVGVVVAMVISTMHEQSCIYSHNARKFEKSSKIQSVILVYHNDEIAEVSKSWISQVIITIRRNYPEKVFSYKIEPGVLFELSLISLKTIDT